MTMFYVGCYRPTTTLLLYPGLGQAVNGALAELVDAMVRRNVSILCVQETKWVGEKVRIIEPWGYKL